MEYPKRFNSDRANEQKYSELFATLSSLLGEEKDPLANMANFTAFIYHNLPDLNWAGFYLMKESCLLLGPFQGKPACIRIDLGKGVCGLAAKNREAQLVPNVHEFTGHIACDTESNSEMVLPVIKNDTLVGVFDLDSPYYDRFKEADCNGVGKLLELFIAKTDLSRLD